MKPNLPLSWVGTVTPQRPTVLFHLEAGAHLGVRGTGCGIGRVPTKAKPGTTFLDNPQSDIPSPRCQKCEAMAEKLRRPAIFECPACDHRITLAERDSLVDPGMPCPKCHTFRLDAFLPVPR